MQSIQGSAVKAEPWMHLCFMKYKEQGSEVVKLCYGIYIWDTRQVIEAKVIDFGDNFNACQRLQFYFANPAKGYNVKASKLYHAVNAIDNGLPLQGGGDIVKQINQRLFK